MDTEELVDGSTRTAVLESHITADQIGDGKIQARGAAEIVRGGDVWHWELVVGKRKSPRTRRGSGCARWLTESGVVVSRRKIGNCELALEIRLDRSTRGIGGVGEVVPHKDRDV